MMVFDGLADVFLNQALVLMRSVSDMENFTGDRQSDSVGSNSLS